MNSFNESHVEDAALDGPAPECVSYNRVLFVSRSRAALEPLNAHLRDFVSGEIRLREAEKAVEAVA